MNYSMALFENWDHQSIENRVEWMQPANWFWNISSHRKWRMPSTKKLCIDAWLLVTNGPSQRKGKALHHWDSMAAICSLLSRWPLSEDLSFKELWWELSLEYNFFFFFYWTFFSFFFLVIAMCCLFMVCLDLEFILKMYMTNFLKEMN